MRLIDADDATRAVGGFLKPCKCETKQTNADRIRSMTDAELAHFIVNIANMPIVCKKCQYNNNELCYILINEDRACTDEDAETSVKKWLEEDSEV